MNDANRYYTRGAQDGADVSQRFQEKLSDIEVSPGRYRAEITMPHGPSTGGGAVAQRIRLVPRLGGRPVLVIGSVVMHEARAEVRTIEHLEAIHRLRYRKPLELNRVLYTQLVGRMLAFFESEYMKATMEPLPRQDRARQRAVLQKAGGGWSAMATRRWRRRRRGGARRPRLVARGAVGRVMDITRHSLPKVG
jgi:hypothetical protein